MRIFEASKPHEVGAYFQKGTEAAGKRALFAAAARLVSHIQTEVIPREMPQPVDRGLYRAGWRFKRLKDGAEVYNVTPQGPLIEDGVRAKNVKRGRKMINALVAWVRRKGIVKGRGKNAMAEARSVAFAIAARMKRTGIFNRGGKKGLRILKKALERAPEFVQEEFKREVEKGIG